MVTLIIIGVCVLVNVLILVVEEFKNKKGREYHKEIRRALEEKYSEEAILDAQQGFGPDELLKEYYYND